MALGSQGFDIPLHGQGTDLERPSDFSAGEMQLSPLTHA
jgi:hypothetical protein